MKHLFIMLLIACSTITTANAQSKNQSKVKTKPENVINSLNFIMNQYGKKEGQTYSVNKNPNTNIIESSERVVRFNCRSNVASMELLSTNFKNDESVSYQILHIMPGSTQKFSMNVITSTTGSKYYHIRTKDSQEMWFMACKNPDNPQLRDAYAIVWEKGLDGMVEGTVYMITSLRPDIYEKEMETSKKTFKIEGRVDANIKDSLYNIYIADSYAALNAVGDDDYVACVPVINKRFEYQTELDRPMVGRLRCIFPDGELCSAWIDLDFVPGETYHITVHNGYYDDDADYERRVGRYSGKSLLNSEMVVDTVAVIDDFVAEPPVVSEFATPQPGRASNWEPSPQVKMQLEQKAVAIKAQMDAIKATYMSMKPYFELRSLTGTDRIFAQITKQNKELDAKMQDFIKMLKGMETPINEKARKAEALSSICKEFLKFYTEQNQGFTEMYKEVGVLTKAAQKTQKYINQLTEKYMTEMSKMMTEMK